MRTKELNLKLLKLNAQQLLVYDIACKKKSTYALLFIFLSGFGAQWFYIRKPAIAILMIFMSIVSLVGILNPFIAALSILVLILNLCCIPYAILRINDYNSAIIDSMALTNG
jgi:hypothetical protein